MAAQVFNRISQLGLGLAVVGGVVNSALYNGESKNLIVFEVINVKIAINFIFIRPSIIFFTHDNTC